MLNFILPGEQNRKDVLSFYDEIEKNGGIFENELYDPNEEVTVKRFWIQLTDK